MMKMSLFGHMRSYERETTTQEEWSPRVVRPDGHTSRTYAESQASRVYDENYTVVDGKLRRVSNAE